MPSHSATRARRSIAPTLGVPSRAQVLTTPAPPVNYSLICTDWPEKTDSSCSIPPNCTVGLTMTAAPSSKLSLFKTFDVMLTLKIVAATLLPNTIWPDEYFADFVTTIPRIQWLEAANLGLSRVDSITLDHGNLQYLDLSSNNLASLPAPRLGKLHDLHLDANLLTTLALGTFAGTPLLKNLVLSANLFTSWDARLFAGLNQLQSLVLSYNPVTSLPSTLFHSLTAATYIDISGMRLTSAPPTLLQCLSALAFLDISINSLSTVPPTFFLPAT